MSNSLGTGDMSQKRIDFLNEINKAKYSYIEITEKDKKANDLFLKKIKPTLIFPEDFYYNLAMKYKNDIESSEFFKDINNMPKGCLLHLHMVDCIDVEWISKEVMKEENLKNIYMRRFLKKYDILIYTLKPDENEPHFDKPFKPIIEEYLKENKDKTVYDYFHLKLSLPAEEVEKAINNDETWKLFMPRYFFCYYLILNKNFYKQHIRNAFRQCIEGKQYRLEARLSLGRVRDDNYEYIPTEEEFNIYKEELDNINNEFKPKEKFTFGIIIEMIRNKSDEVIKDTIIKSIELKKKYPDLICGIDLSGDENNFRTFQQLTPIMLTNTCPDLPWILHSGESIKNDNQNMVDSFLINAKRVGHCINLFKMGTLFEHYKNKGVVLEINPISNQTLRQVRDLRIHPAIGYHNYGMKICINNDDPTIYNTKGNSYDYFVACAAMEFNIIDFKCFGLNSIDGAQIPDDLKMKYKKMFEEDWNQYLDEFIKKYENK